MSDLTHFNAAGDARMVDVGEKGVTERSATAGATVIIGTEALALVKGGTSRKGDVLAVARVAGIMAAKRTADLIPLCHPLPLTHVDIAFDLDPDTASIAITAMVGCRGRTGVEMEALTVASVTALTIYDMLKSVNRSIRIQDLRLLAKRGGKSGDYTGS